jgi:hypothetical protein
MLGHSSAGEGAAQPESLALYATVIVGAVTALAPAIPLPVRMVLLPLATVVWLAAIALALVRVVRRRRDVIRSRIDVAFVVIGVVGIALATLSMIELSLVRLGTGRDALFWSEAWRFALAHAQTVARSGGLEDSNDFAGYPLNYHVGSSWLAGMWEYTFGGGVTEVLYGVVPFAATISFALGAISLLVRVRVPVSAAILASGTVMTLVVEAVPSELVHDPLRVLRHLHFRIFSVDVMLNLSFGLAVSACTLALLQRRERRDLIVGALGLASLYWLKPQCFLAVGAIVAVTSCAGMIRWRLPEPKRLFRAAVIALGCLLVAVQIVFPRLPATEAALMAAKMTGVFCLVALATIPSFSGAASSTRSLAMLIAGAGALALVVVGHFLLPAGPQESFAGLKLNWDLVPYDDYCRVATLGFVAACIAWSWRIDRTADGGGLGLARHTMQAFSLLVLLAYFTRFTASAATYRQLSRFGMRFPMSGILRYQLIWQTQTVLNLFLALPSTGVLVTFALRAKNRIVPIVCAVGCAVVVLSMLAILIPPAIDPMNGLEAVEQVDLRDTLAAVPTRGTLLVVNDLAEPGTAHDGLGQHLPAHFGHRFYVAILSYHRWRLPDAPVRLDELHRFFEAPWSPQHLPWLRWRGITHVLVSQRCPTGWDQPPGFALVARHGNWAVYQVPRTPGTQLAPVSLPPSTPMQQRWGEGPCLSVDPE